MTAYCYAINVEFECKVHWNLKTSLSNWNMAVSWRRDRKFFSGYWTGLSTNNAVERLPEYINFKESLYLLQEEYSSLLRYCWLC